MSPIVSALRYILAIPFFLFSLALVVGLSLVGGLFLVVSHEENPKQWLADSRVYEKAPDLIIDTVIVKMQTEAQKENAGMSMDEFLSGYTTKDELRKEARGVLDPVWVQGEAERLIDEAYAYAGGETDTFTPRVDLSGREEKARVAITSIFKRRFAALPLCPAGTAGTLAHFDIFKAICRPASISVAQANKAIDENFQDFAPLKDMGAGEIKLGGATPKDGPDPRRIMLFVKDGFLLTVSSLGILLALLFFLIPGNRAKFIVLSVLFFLSLGLVVGATLFAPHAAKDAYARYVLPQVPAEAQMFLPFAENIMRSALKTLTHTWFVFGLGLVVLVLVFATLAFYHERVSFVAKILMTLILVLSLIGAGFSLYDAKSKGLFTSLNEPPTKGLRSAN